MRFTLTQEIEGDADAVAGALVDPDLIARMDELPALAAVRLVGQERDGEVVDQRVWYRFEADLSAAVRAVVDPARLSWTEVSTFDLRAHTGEHRIEPEHYGHLLSGAYSSRLDARPGRSRRVRRVIEGGVRVRVPLVGGRVERVIVDGLRDNAAAQARLLSEWLRR